jgi:hypothetical protein
MINQTCPNCGAPCTINGACDYCSDPSLLAERKKHFRDFISSLNHELDYIPAGLGWLILLIWVGLPLIVILYCIQNKPSGMNIAAGFLFSLGAFIISTIVAGAIRGEYRRWKFKNELTIMIRKYLLRNQISLSYFF